MPRTRRRVLGARGLQRAEGGAARPDVEVELTGHLPNL